MTYESESAVAMDLVRCCEKLGVEPFRTQLARDYGAFAMPELETSETTLRINSHVSRW